MTTFFPRKPPPPDQERRDQAVSVTATVLLHAALLGGLLLTAVTGQPPGSDAARVLRPGGRLVVATLAEHRHEEAMRAYDHVNLGISPDQLGKLLRGAGLTVESCRISSRETRAPYFEVVTALGRK